MASGRRPEKTRRPRELTPTPAPLTPAPSEIAPPRARSPCSALARAAAAPSPALAARRGSSRCIGLSNSRLQIASSAMPWWCAIQDRITSAARPLIVHGFVKPVPARPSVLLHLPQVLHAATGSTASARNDEYGEMTSDSAGRAASTPDREFRTARSRTRSPPRPRHADSEMPHGTPFCARVFPLYSHHRPHALLRDRARIDAASRAPASGIRTSCRSRRAGPARRGTACARGPGGTTLPAGCRPWQSPRNRDPRLRRQQVVVGRLQPARSRRCTRPTAPSCAG